MVLKRIYYESWVIGMAKSCYTCVHPEVCKYVAIVQKAGNELDGMFQYGEDENLAEAFSKLTACYCIHYKERETNG